SAHQDTTRPVEDASPPGPMPHPAEARSLLFTRCGGQDRPGHRPPLRKRRASTMRRTVKAILVGLALILSGGHASAQLFFDGFDYIVGPTIAPVSNVSTGFSGEEHIAVDPNDPGFLVAAVMDFNLRPFGTDGSHRSTTKYAVSVDNGATWRESFIPLIDN